MSQSCEMYNYAIIFFATSNFILFFVTENVGNAELEVVTPVIEELGKISSIFAYFSLSFKSLKFYFIS